MHLATLALLLLLVIFATACTSSPTGTRPGGFTLAATVHPPEDGAPSQQPRPLRPARYVVETDRALRVATAPMLGRPGADFPPQVRRLSPWQMDDLWQRTVQAGLLDPTHPGIVQGPPPAPEDAQFATAVFEVTRDYTPRIIVIVLDSASPETIAAAELLDHLADLAWIKP